MTAGEKVAIRVDFAEKTLDAKIKLEWESTNNPREVVPQYQLFSSGGNAISNSKGNPALNVYPNPAASQLIIEFPGQVIHAITIIDIYGRTVFLSKESAFNSRTLDISQLPEGVYFLEAICGNDAAGIRFIKKK